VASDYCVDHTIVPRKMIHYDSFRKVLYTAKTHTAGGRGGGATRTFDRHLDVKLAAPGTAGSGTNPEQLFAAG
jgi:organic hydroperoxide reductase OsmC/OhrA